MVPQWEPPMLPPPPCCWHAPLPPSHRLPIFNATQVLDGITVHALQAREMCTHSATHVAGGSTPPPPNSAAKASGSHASVRSTRSYRFMSENTMRRRAQMCPACGAKRRACKNAASES